MSESVPAKCLQIQSNAHAAGHMELVLAEVEVPAPKENEVTIRVEAAPINPSDLGLLLGPGLLRGFGLLSSLLRDLCGSLVLGLLRPQVDQRLHAAVGRRVAGVGAVQPRFFEASKTHKGTGCTYNIHSVQPGMYVDLRMLAP